jgi:hypothetical protein
MSKLFLIIIIGVLTIKIVVTLVGKTIHLKLSVTVKKFNLKFVVSITNIVVAKKVSTSTERRSGGTPACTAGRMGTGHLNVVVNKEKTKAF